MSQENVGVIRAAIESWQRGDDTWVEVMDAEIEWDNSAYPAVGVPERGMGRESFIRFLDRYLAAWDRYEATYKELIDAGDDVVVVLQETVRAGGSDAPMGREVAGIWTIHGGKAVRYRAFRTKADALKAAGLSE